ncbi:MAG: hypothetical protein AAF600_10915 [Bacteroidota bacterium]
MALVKGDVRILQIKVDGIYVPIGCLTSNDFDETVEMLPTTTRASNGWQTSIPTNQTFNIVFEGIQKLNDDTVLSYDDIKVLKRARTRIEWGLFTEGGLTDEGFGYITEVGESAAVGEFLSFTGNILGYGEPVFINVDGDLFQNGNVMLFQNGNAMIFN